MASQRKLKRPMRKMRGTDAVWNQQGPSWAPRRLSKTKITTPAHHKHHQRNKSNNALRRGKLLETDVLEIKDMHRL